MDEILEEATKYLEKYGNTREADLLNYLIKVKRYPQRTVKARISKSTGKQFHRVVHPTKPPAVYLSLEAQEEKGLPLELQKELIRAQAAIRAAELSAYGHGERQ